jgi:hypothetical protein
MGRILKLLAFWKVMKWVFGLFFGRDRRWRRPGASL